MDQIKKGDLAVCSRGDLGIITSDAPQRVVYKQCENCVLRSVPMVGEVCEDLPCTCETGIAWTGIHLIGEKVGQPWSSRNPRKVATLEKTESDAFILTPWNGYGKALFHPKDASNAASS